MSDPLAIVGEALAAVMAAWPVSPAGERVAVDALSHAQLVELNGAIGALRRGTEAVHARVASEISRQSHPDVGSDSLAKKNGYRNAATFIAATTGTTVSDASRLVAVGDATAPRRMFSGADAPARHPHVAAALSAGRIGMPAASAIITMLDRVALRAHPQTIAEVERLLTDQALGLSLDQLAKAIARAEAYLDPDGLEPKESEVRGERSLVMFERNGMVHLNAKLDPESAAPVKAALESIVTAEFRNEGRAGGSSMTDAPTPDASIPESAGGRDCVAQPGDADAPRRTLPQRQADALVLLASHLLGCSSDTPINGATVIIRMTLADLESGTGSATIDGIDQPVSIATARRMAASGSVIPCVLGGDSEILDWGRQKRLFTPAQKLALAERDGGCAMCGLPPGMTKVHHLRWWMRDRGSTDLSNGVLLCETCHHRIHDNGWEIEIEGTGVDARVWFIPPAHVDPRRTPRLGGNRRFAFVA
ncbi:MULTISPECIES: HNH endonuclease signature motif containing protein [Microbacterium]|uniref:HNH endonuclease n=1 Tax=Microbacterium TaxID=33882 RepID=UPI00146D9B2D|nr:MULTISPECIES: HNH endonuclease signature motif containing protein [Microbacterium]